MRDNFINGILKPAVIVVVFLTIPVGAARYYSLIVTNSTPYFIDLQLEDYYESYVPSGETVTLESAGREMTAYANYSPGQGVSGYASKIIDGTFSQHYSTGTDCAGRTVLYGESGGCGKPVMETIPGYPDSEEWNITEAKMAGLEKFPDE